MFLSDQTRTPSSSFVPASPAQTPLQRKREIDRLAKVHVSTGALSSAVKMSATKAGYSSVRSDSIHSTIFSQRRLLHESNRHKVHLHAEFPPLVREYLNSMDESTLGDTSGHIHPSGVVWLVHRKGIFLWSLAAPGSSSSVLCHHMDFSFSTGKLVAILSRNSNNSSHRLSSTVGDLQGVGLLACSQDGRVRLWPNVKNRSSHLELSISLPEGDRAFSVLELGPGCGQFALITVKGNVFILSTLSSSQQYTLQSKRLDNQMRSVFSSLTRFFGLENRPANEQICSIATTSYEGRHFLYMMSETHLHRWSFDKSFAAKIDYVAPLSEQMSSSLAAEEERTAGELKVTLFDVFAEGSTVYVSCASTALASDDAPLSYYHIVKIHVDEPKNLVQSIHTLDYEHNHSSAKGPAPATLAIPKGGPHAFLLWSGALAVTAVPHDIRPLDLVALGPRPDCYLGAGVLLAFVSSVFVISLKRGIVSIYQVPESVSSDTTGTSLVDASHLELDPSSLGSFDEVLLTAYKTYAAGDLPRARQLLAATGGSAGRFEQACAAVSRAIVNTPPSNDPRWADDPFLQQQGGGSSLPSTASMLLHHFLQDKCRKHEVLRDMLTDCELWGALSAGARGALLTDGSLLEASMALHAFLSQPHCATHSFRQQAEAGLEDPPVGTLLLAAMERVLAARGIAQASWRGSGLNVADVFFTEITSIVQIISALQTTAAAYQDGRDLLVRAAIALTVNTVILALVASGRAYDDKHRHTYLLALDTASHTYRPLPPRAAADESEDTAPLTSLWPDRSDIRELLRTQTAHTAALIDSLRHAAETSPLAAALLADLLQSHHDLTYSLLHSLTAAVTSASTDSAKDKAYAAFLGARTEALPLFLQTGYYSLALSLAETYKDFRTVIEILVQLRPDKALLYDYMDRYREEGFAHHLFHYYIHHQMLHPLLSEIPDEFDAELNDFVMSHPAISWIQLLKTGHYADASQALFQHSEEEAGCVERKRTLLSLAKLSALAATEAENPEEALSGVIQHVVAEAEDGLEVLRAQCELTTPTTDTPPFSTLLLEDVASETPCLSVDVIVDQLLGPISEPRPDLTADDVLYALDLFNRTLAKQASEESAAFVLSIWRRALAANNWAGLAGDWENALIDDHTLQHTLHTSVFVAAGIAYTDRGALTPELFSALLDSWPQAQPALKRLLQVAYRLVETERRRLATEMEE